MPVITGAKLHSKQAEILTDIMESDAKYFVINASRQAGKSFLLAEALRVFGLSNVGVSIMYTTPTYDLGDTFYTNIIESLEGIPVIKSTNKSKLTIDFVNGTKIRFKSAERYENIRGGSYDFVFLDEFAFYKPGAWTAIKPTIAAKKNAKVIIVSTPRGKELFFEMAMLGKSDNPRYVYYTMHYSDNPMYDLEEVADARNVLPDAVYRQEYEAEFLDDGGTVFRSISKRQTVSSWSLPGDGTNFFAGLDIGKKDSTVLTIYDNKGNIAYIHSDKEKGYDRIIEGLIPVLERYNPLVYVETNGVGDVFYDILVTKYKRLVPWVNSNGSKTDLIESFVAAIETGRVGLPTKELCKALELEMNVFIYSYNPKTRKISYFAQPPFHDDHVISAALGYKAMAENRGIGRRVMTKPENKYRY